MKVFETVLLLFLLSTVKVNGACVLGGLSPSLCMPDFCTLLYSAFGNWLSSDIEDDTTERHLRYDKSSSSWTYDCPCTKDCEYGVDPGDIDTCPSCLLGPGETCDSWSGTCGDGLLCQYSGPMSCSGMCVCEEEFNSRQIGDTCGEWDGSCQDGLRCKYNEESEFLSHLSGGFMHECGQCVTEEDYNLQAEGEICDDGHHGACAEGLKCQKPMFPFFPNICMKIKDDDTNCNATYQTEESVLKEIFHDANDDPFAGEIDIVLVEDDDADDEKVMFDIIDAIEHMIPALGFEEYRNPETGEIEVQNHESADENNDVDTSFSTTDVGDNNNELVVIDLVTTGSGVDDTDVNIDEILDLTFSTSDNDQDQTQGEIESFDILHESNKSEKDGVGFQKVSFTQTSDSDQEEGDIDIGSDFGGFLRLLMGGDEENEMEFPDVQDFKIIEM